MKIAILGYSGSGKSTLAQLLAKTYCLPVLHFDTIQFLPDWVIRGTEEKQQLTTAFLQEHDSWVIDGNYSKLSFDERMEQADTIILLLFNRLSCFYRAYKRSRMYKNKTRPDMADGCTEKFDLEFAKWILWKGRSKETIERFQKVIDRYHEKVVVIRNQKDLDNYIKQLPKSTT